MRAARMQRNLERAWAAAPVVALGADEKLVVFSDIHLGDGSRNDDFAGNAGLFARVLADEYLDRGFGLALNGDVEEFLRFTPAAVARQWQAIYGLFERFRGANRLLHLAGNHDPLPRAGRVRRDARGRLDAVRLKLAAGELFLLHGHQAAGITAWGQFWLRAALRLLATPLGIRNYTVAARSVKQFAIEKAIYDFAKGRKVAAAIGHTHRPLFESLSKVDQLRFRIEKLLRKHRRAAGPERRALERRIRSCHGELVRTLARNERHDRLTSIYESGDLVPCLFNSGSCIGDSGITCLEIENGKLALVLWFDRSHRNEYFAAYRKKLDAHGDGSYYRLVIKQEDLDYIFTRIRLLS